MLKPLTSLNLVTRMDMDMDTWLISGTQSGGTYPATGTWVKITGADAVGKPSSGDFGFPIWSESARDGKGGWSPDVLSTQKVSVIFGKLRAVTDQCGTGITVGTALKIDADGKLIAQGGSGAIVAYCTKANFSDTYLGTTYSSCIEFVTV